MPVKPCRDHAGIVDHKAVSLMKIFQDIRKMSVLYAPVLHGKMKESGRASVLERILGDQLFRKIIIKI